MSAYMVDLKHVVYLVQAGVSLQLAQGDGGSISWFHDETRETARCTSPDSSLAAIASMLWAANLKSIHARYPDTIGGAGIPGEIYPDGFGYVVTESEIARFRWAGFDPVQVIKACACFDYQACEAAGYYESEAHAFIKALRYKAIDHLAGYDDAEWGAPEPVANRDVCYCVEG